MYTLAFSYKINKLCLKTLRGLFSLAKKKKVRNAIKRTSCYGPDQDINGSSLIRVFSVYHFVKAFQTPHQTVTGFRLNVRIKYSKDPVTKSFLTLRSTLND